MPGEKILYFAYCVNMFSSRMEFCVDSKIVRMGNGRLDGHKLLFGSYNEGWAGCLPTIVKSQCSDDVVWGVLWELDPRLKPRLDRLQEVTAKIYEPVEVDVYLLKKQGTVRALSYRLVKRPMTPILYNGVPKLQYRPSKLYLEEMVDGAEEAGLPAYYQKELRAIAHNGCSGKSSGEGWAIL